MQNRFKFKAVLHKNKYEEYRLEKFSHQRVFDVMSINLGIEYSTIEIIAEYPNGDWAVREIDDEDIDLIQCTGLKDKNGTLIYIGDVVKDDTTNSIYKVGEKKCAIYLENDEYIGYFHELSMAFAEKRLEVIGNIYDDSHLIENSKLLEVEND